MAILNDNALVGASGQSKGYQVSRSLRFSAPSSKFLSRTPASAGNRKTWTWSGWVKKVNNTTSRQFIFNADVTSNNSTIEFKDNAISVFDYNSGAYQWQVITNALFRDNSSWLHLVVTVDTTQATSSNRVKVYVNGAQQTFSAANYPSQDYQSKINSTVDHRIGSLSGDASFNLDGYLADIWFLDGIAATPSDFAETDATTGQWIPKTYTGSKGTNGFHLEFADNSAATAAALGKDTSGNSPANNWTPNNLSVITGGPTSVAAASGALPIYNTTGTYGDTKGSGTRTDSNSSSIVLAIPMDGANNGTTFTDESATIKGSGSAKSLTRTGTVTSTAQSKFYGSSGYFDGASRLTVDLSSVSLSSAYTVEFWWYKAGTQSGNHGHFCLNGANNQTIAYREAAATGTGSNDFYVDLGGTFVPGLITQTINTGSWNHFAFVHEGSGVFKSYLNGVLQTTKTVGTTGTMGSTTSIGGGIGSYTGQFINGYVSDYRIYQTSKYTSNFNPPSATQNTSIAPGNDSLVDTPTSYGTDTGAGGEVSGNYCTWNPLKFTFTRTFTNGNLDLSVSSSQNLPTLGTIGVKSGKWYWEITPTTVVASRFVIGVADQSWIGSDLGDTQYSYGYINDARKYNNGSASAYGATYVANDVIGVALDMDAGTLTFYKNGVSQGQAFSGITQEMFPAVGSTGASGAEACTANFGQRPFAYTAPSGFKALCDTNLPAPVVAKPSTVMDVLVFAATNANNTSITGLSFQPDLVWGKSRTNAYSHQLYDSVRGVNKNLKSNTTGAEVTDTVGLTSFDSNGFTAGVDFNVILGSGSSVAWCWDAGSSTVTNTQGSITSQVRANASAGFSIVTYSGNAVSGSTIGHGLGVAPSLIITKSRTAPVAGQGWQVGHASLGWTKRFYLETTNAAMTTAGAWNNTAPTSTVFTVGNSDLVNDTGYTYVAYCFAPVAGYSSAFSYSGNGSSDGPFCFLGFRPRFLIIKRTDAAYGWYMYDTARDTYNIAGKELLANVSDAEVSDTDLDILSNGFKPRRSSLAFNASGGTFIGFAWAESPFQYARAR